MAAERRKHGYVYELSLGEELVCTPFKCSACGRRMYPDAVTVHFNNNEEMTYQ